MADTYHEVFNYLDKNVVFVGDGIAPLDMPKLKKAFPGVDSATLEDYVKQWICARETIEKLTANLI